MDYKIMSYEEVLGMPLFTNLGIAIETIQRSSEDENIIVKVHGILRNHIIREDAIEAEYEEKK